MSQFASVHIILYPMMFWLIGFLLCFGSLYVWEKQKKSVCCVRGVGGWAFSMCLVGALSMTTATGIGRTQLSPGMLRPGLFVFGYAVAPAGLPPAGVDSRLPLAVTWQHLSTHGRAPTYLPTYCVDGAVIA